MLVAPKVNWPALPVLLTPEDGGTGLGLLLEEEEEEEAPAPNTKLNGEEEDIVDIELAWRIIGRYENDIGKRTNVTIKELKESSEKKMD